MPRPRAHPLFELGGQWIAYEHGSRNLYRFWNDPGSGRTRRESLGTADLEAAKRKLAEIVVTNAPKSGNALLSTVLLSYFQERTDKLPSKKQSRNAGRVLLKCWGPMIKVAAITEQKQKEFARWSLARGFSLAYVARNLTVLKAAFSHFNLNAPSKIVCSEAKMRERWGLVGKAPRRAFIPTDEELMKLLGHPMPERLKRWIVISLLTGCRPEAALDLSPEARQSGASLIDLNPAGRVQNRKYRPTVRVPRTLRAFLNAWEKGGLDAFGGRYCGYTTVEGVKTALERIRSDEHVNLPQLSTYSFRHKVATILRSARNPGRVPEDQIAVQMGHKRKDMRSTAGYGEWDPDYLKEASDALDAWFLRVRRELFSQDSPKSVTTRTEEAA